MISSLQLLHMLECARQQALPATAV